VPLIILISKAAGAVRRMVSQCLRYGAHIAPAAAHFQLHPVWTFVYKKLQAVNLFFVSKKHAKRSPSDHDNSYGIPNRA